MIHCSLDSLSFDGVWEEIGWPEGPQAWDQCYQTLGAKFRQLEALGAAITEVHEELDAARNMGTHVSRSLSVGGDCEDVVPLLPEVVAQLIMLSDSHQYDEETHYRSLEETCQAIKQGGLAGRRTSCQTSDVAFVEILCSDRASEIHASFNELKIDVACSKADVDWGRRYYPLINADVSNPMGFDNDLFARAEQ